LKILFTVPHSWWPGGPPIVFPHDYDANLHSSCAKASTGFYDPSNAKFLLLAKGIDIDRGLILRILSYRDYLRDSPLTQALKSGRHLGGVSRR